VDARSAALPALPDAIERLIEALRAVDIQGVKHNVPAVLTVLDSGAFRDGDVHTGIIPQVMAQKKAAA